jgi:hypothetical protein
MRVYVDWVSLAYWGFLTGLFLLAVLVTSGCSGYRKDAPPPSLDDWPGYNPDDCYERDEDGDFPECACDENPGVRPEG